MESQPSFKRVGNTWADCPEKDDLVVDKLLFGIDVHKSVARYVVCLFSLRGLVIIDVSYRTGFISSLEIHGPTDNHSVTASHSLPVLLLMTVDKLTERNAGDFQGVHSILFCN